MATPKLSAIRNPTLCIPLAIDRGGLSHPNKQDDSAGPLVAGFPATLGRIVTPPYGRFYAIRIPRAIRTNQF